MKESKKSAAYWENMATVWAGTGEKRRRGLRILPKNKGYFVHVTSRTVGQAFLFGELEKRVFIRLMRQWAEFSGLGVITHCLMDNHFHAMLWVPAEADLDHEGLRRRLEGVWPEEKLEAWEAHYQLQSPEIQAGMDAAVRERMANLPEFMRVLKQSFTRWYNRKEDRKGTLWDSRYRSVVVEDSPLALMSVAAYIDLNPLRAGMVKDPMAYPWSGYGAAMGGEKAARKGLELLVCLSRGHLPAAAQNVRKQQLGKAKADWREIAPAMRKEGARRAAPQGWKEVQAAYRIWLVSKGEEQTGVRKRKGLDPVQVIGEYERQGMVPLSVRLQLRRKAFTRGLALGGEGFLEELMAEYRSCFGPRRKKAARRIPGMGSGLRAMRELS